ncbi:DEAD/DEAH box helicase, partial [bacterium]|nr:DEAD/DEAH box helicase [bacterium]
MKKGNSVYDEASHRILGKESFKEALESLLKEQRILHTQNENKLPLKTIKLLLESASVFSFSSEEKLKHLAYKIATIIADIYGNSSPNLNYPIQYIIVSTGLIPGLKKNTKDTKIDLFSVYGDSDTPLNPLQFKPILYQLAKNSIGLSYKDEPIYLTDYQRDVIASLEDGKSISLSAPTSAGKSFIIVSYLVERISKSKGAVNVAYIVPTRALINQVIKDFRHELRDFGLENILITSNPSNYEHAKKKKKIFVFTQERLHTLLFDTEFDEELNILIIDEAHKISDVERGILLEEVIEETIVSNPNIQIIFISP